MSVITFFHPKSSVVTCISCHQDANVKLINKTLIMVTFAIFFKQSETYSNSMSCLTIKCYVFLLTSFSAKPFTTLLIKVNKVKNKVIMHSEHFLPIIWAICAVYETKTPSHVDLLTSSQSCLFSSSHMPVSNNYITPETVYSCSVSSKQAIFLSFLKNSHS